MLTYLISVFACSGPFVPGHFLGESVTAEMVRALTALWMFLSTNRPHLQTFQAAVPSSKSAHSTYVQEASARL